MGKFFDEIHEQPQALERTLRHYLSSKGCNLLDKTAKLWASGKYTSLVFTGMGSSYFVSCAAASLLNAGGINASAIDTGELLHFRYPSMHKDTLLVAISQSGECYEVVKLLEKLREEDNCPTVIGITNTEGSSLNRLSEIILPCFAGKEDMTSTKTFICTYLVAYLLAEKILGKPVDAEILEKLPGWVADGLAGKEEYLRKAVDALGEYKFVQVVARGPVFASASQTALMFMEATKTPASALLGGEFRHGPLEMVGKDFIGVLFAHSASGVFPQMERLVSDILAFGGKVILLTDKKLAQTCDNLLQIVVECEDADLFAIPAIVPLQLMVDRWAEEKNLIPGNFTRANKVTSTE